MLHPAVVEALIQQQQAQQAQRSVGRRRWQPPRVAPPQQPPLPTPRPLWTAAPAAVRCWQAVRSGQTCRRAVQPRWRARHSSSKAGSSSGAAAGMKVRWWSWRQYQRDPPWRATCQHSMARLLLLPRQQLQRQQLEEPAVCPALHPHVSGGGGGSRQRRRRRPLCLCHRLTSSSSSSRLHRLPGRRMSSNWRRIPARGVCAWLSRPGAATQQMLRGSGMGLPRVAAGLGGGWSLLVRRCPQKKTTCKVGLGMGVGFGCCWLWQQGGWESGDTAAAQPSACLATRVLLRLLSACPTNNCRWAPID